MNPAPELPPITARHLLAWADREESRRRETQRLPLSLPAWVLALALGGLAAAEVGRRAAADPSEGVILWMLAAGAAVTLAAMGAPFRLYWRHDAPLLYRLPLPGDVLFRAALWRSARTAGRALAFSLPGALVAAALAGDFGLGLRLVSALAAGAVAAATLAPAAALGAGAMVASERARAAASAVTGDVQAPPTAWLGILPGVAAAAIALALIFSSEWAQTGGASPAPGILAALAAAGVALAAWAHRAAPGAMPAAMREISALDRERLAHVERVGPSALERAWGRAFGRGPAGRRIFAKDATLLRRRYPMVYVASAAGVGALWIVAAARPEGYATWAAGILAALGAYAWVVARRLWSPPIENARFLRTLPMPAGAVRSAKLASAAMRVLVPAALGSAALLPRAEDLSEAGFAVAGVSLAALAGAAIAARKPPRALER